MIICPNCSAQNSPLIIKCTKCGSYIQPRVANLDLFKTLWEIIEKPKSTFSKICLSEQKNYVFLLFSVFGIGLCFASFWYINIGNKYPHLLNLLFSGLATGPFLGTILLLIISLLLYFISRFIFKTEGTFRNLLSITAYSMTPIVLSTILILPVELIIFGLYFFMNNPSPYILKPIPYYILISLDGICILYSLILFFIGIKVANNIKFLKSILITLIIVGILIFLIYYFWQFVKSVI